MITSRKSRQQNSRAQELGGTCLVVVIVWFVWLYPLVPNTLVGLIAELVSGILVFLYGWACVSAINWLLASSRFAILSKATAVLIALLLGVGIFTAAYFARDFVLCNFNS